MLPYIEDQQASGNWRAAAFHEFCEKRIGINSTAARTTPMWDWQWRMVAKRGFERLSLYQQARAAPSASRYWTILHCALERGVLHRLNMHDRFTAMLLPPIRVDVRSLCVSNSPLRVQCVSQQRGAAEWPQTMSVKLNGEVPLKFEAISPPRGGERSLQVSEADGAVWLPDVAGTVELEFKFSDTIPIDKRKPSEPDSLPVTYVQRIRVSAGQLHDVMYPVDDPSIDQMIQDGFGYRFLMDEGNQVSKLQFHLSKECVINTPEFNAYVGRATLFRNGKEVFRGSTRFDISFDKRHPWGTAIAEFRLSDEAAKLVDAATSRGDQAAWTIRFDLDEQQMLLWTVRPGMRYWNGRIERSIEWN
jgi:hypothetical protein